VVGAGLGTSGAPVRLLAPPELLVLELHPCAPLLTSPSPLLREGALRRSNRAGIAYEERRHVQGVHIAYARARRRPFGRCRSWSARTACSPSPRSIVRWADAKLPQQRRLFLDAGPEVAALCRRLDERLGPGLGGG